MINLFAEKLQPRQCIKLQFTKTSQGTLVCIFSSDIDGLLPVSFSGTAEEIEKDINSFFLDGVIPLYETLSIADKIQKAKDDVAAENKVLKQAKEKALNKINSVKEYVTSKQYDKAIFMLKTFSNEIPISKDLFLTEIQRIEKIKSENTPGLFGGLNIDAYTNELDTPDHVDNDNL